MLDLNNPEIRFALRAVRQATLLVQSIQSEMVTPALTKEDRSPVTVADYASQALVTSMLCDAFPNDPLVAEEDAGALRRPENAPLLRQVSTFAQRFEPLATLANVLRWLERGHVDTAPRYWTLDPIDGTKGFLRGDQYVVALALVVEGLVQVGALGCPNLRDPQQPPTASPGRLVIAARGQGAWSTDLRQNHQFRPLHVSSINDPSQARLLRSFESGHTNPEQVEALIKALGIQTEPISMDSQAKYVLLAEGSGDLMVRLLSEERPNYREKIWDQAAGSLILEEAGGRVTDLDGKALDFTTPRLLLNNRGLLASNGLLHSAALEALRAIHA